MNGTYKDILKVYTLIKPPSPEDPFLHPVRHSKVIQQFTRKSDACYTLNSEGEVDIYIILPFGEDFEEFSQVNEEFTLTHRNKNKIEIEICYKDEGKSCNLSFNLDNPLDYHTLERLSKDKRLNIYYINRYDEEYVCDGMKAVYLPGIFCYDLKRCLEGKRPLALPIFSEKIIPDKVITENMLMMKAWGFYLDFTSLRKRIGVAEDADEFISLHILHGMARLQKARLKYVSSDVMIFWIGRKIITLQGQVPREYYCVYLSAEMFTGNKSLDQGANILKKVMLEVPEFVESSWVSPLQEEAIPLVMITGKKIYRLNLTEEFYRLGERVFSEHFKKAKGYESYYLKILKAQKASHNSGKVCDLAQRRREKRILKDIVPAKDLKGLIRSGREEDLPQIFRGLNKIKAGDVDDIFISICEKFREKAEPYLLPLTSSPKYHIKAAAILSLGIIESRGAIPILVEKLSGKKGEAALAKDALAIIGEKAVDFIIPLLNSKKPELRIRALDTLSLIGSEKAISAINNMGRDRSSRVEEAKKRVFHLLLEK